MLLISQSKYDSHKNTLNDLSNWLHSSTISLLRGRHLPKSNIDVWIWKVPRNRCYLDLHCRCYLEFTFTISSFHPPSLQAKTHVHSDQPCSKMPMQYPLSLIFLHLLFFFYRFESSEFLHCDVDFVLALEGEYISRLTWGRWRLAGTLHVNTGINNCVVGG